MKLLEFGFKNICSYGNILNTFKFSNEPELILIEGENGAGKSSIKEALTISIYGKSAVRKMKDIPNRRNRNAYTFCRFLTSTNDEVYIQRGIDPNFFDLTVNGETMNFPDKRKIDDVIENELVGIPFDVFSNTISLSFEDFKSFIKLSASDKRKIVDRILGTSEIFEMKEILKNDIREVKTEISFIEHDIETVNSNISHTTYEMESYKKEIENENQERLKTLIDDKKKLEDEINVIVKEINEVKTNIQNLTKRKTELSDAHNKIKSIQLDIQNKIKLYDNDKCPHCLSDLNDDFHIKMKDNLNNKLNKINSDISKIKDAISKVETDLNKLNSVHLNLNSKKSAVSANIFNLDLEISKLKSQNNNINVKNFNNILEALNNKLNDLKKKLNEKQDTLSVLTEMDVMLSDDGLKKKMMDKIIPILNLKILEISKRLNFKFAFEFDSMFNPIISHLGSLISPDSLSSGERKKMNMIIILSMLELLKMKHPNMNIIFLDEIFVNLDNNSIYNVIELLKDFIKKNNMTVFVISHDPLPEEMFNKKIVVKQKDSFSTLSIEEKQ